MRLGVGTAQFGMDYGMTNHAGKVERAEASGILKLAAELGVCVLDTAPDYGDSESVLGATLASVHPFQIVTKSPVFKTGKITRDHAELLDRSLRESLARLRQDQLYGLLIHHADDLLVPGGGLLIEVMERCVSRGLVSKIGVSVYTSDQIDGVLRLFEPGIVQLPLSVLDQRLIHSGHLTKLRRIGAEIHARSVFLQGLLLTAPVELPAYFDPIRDHLSRYSDFLAASGLDPVEAAIGFVSSVKEVDAMIIGVCSRSQLLALCGVTQRPVKALPDVSRFGMSDPEFLNPARWHTSVN
jgi:aryl-alcohol dehydrogenase-like predicted oxidoreductase